MALLKRKFECVFVYFSEIISMQRNVDKFV